MPSKSEAQHNLMEAAAHDPEFAKKHGIPQSVAQEFVNADKSHPHQHAEDRKPGDHPHKHLNRHG